ncbi:MAG: flagellar type III secretion system pore protein FliP, partial [Clostridiaceae bacterium]|nr:flagellar type III secretion system pore protein FliP [Clostridiaceae bacterium]
MRVAVKTTIASLVAGLAIAAGRTGVNATGLELPTERGDGLELILLLTVLALAPSILILMTGFTRIVIVLSFVRNAVGLQQTPPNQVIIGLALLLTFFFMAPVVDQIGDNAYKPYVEGTITQEEALEAAMDPLRDFMFRQTYKKDMELFMGMAGIQSVETVEDIPTRALIPAFVTSELKRAVQIGFFIFVPFLVIDMIVASTLMSMGMMMLPPTVISLPFKILLFVLVDGWGMTIK